VGRGINEYRFDDHPEVPRAPAMQEESDHVEERSGGAWSIDDEERERSERHSATSEASKPWGGEHPRCRRRATMWRSAAGERGRSTTKSGSVASGTAQRAKRVSHGEASTRDAGGE